MKRLIITLIILSAGLSASQAADFYWTGGSGNWNDASHWTLTPGGAGGNTIPSASDNVFIGQTGRNFSIQITQHAACQNLTIGNNSVTLTGTEKEQLSVYGSVNIGAKVTIDCTILMRTDNDRQTINIASKKVNQIVFDGTGSWEITSEINITNLKLVSGTLSTNGHKITSHLFDISGTQKRELNLKNSVVTIDQWNARNAENLVFNAGNSELVFKGKIDPYTMSFDKLKYNNISSLSNSKAKPTFNMFVSNPNCHDQRGTILVVVTSGVPGYQYFLIGDGIVQYPASGFTTENTHIFNNLLPDKKYLVLLVDQVDSDVKQDTMINPPAIVVASIDLTHITTCPGDATGQIVVNASGGTGSLDYSISEPASYQLSNTFNGLTAGTYPVRVRDDNNCETTASNQNITEPARTIFSSVVIDSIDCHNDDNATITITATNADRTFELSIGGAYQASGIFTPVGDGSYTITARDQTGCIEPYGSNPLVIPNPPVLSATFTTDSINCNGGSDGSITITASGGTTPYQYSITGGEPYTSSNTFNSLGLGTYTVAVKDYHGCTAQAATQANIYQPDVMTKVTDSQVNITCRDANDGQIVLLAADGTKPYTYTIPTKPPIVTGGTATFTGLGQGNYTATVTDAHSCPSSIVWSKHTLANPLAVTFTYIKTNETPCNNSDNGTITITAAGGTGSGYTYTINNGTSWESNGGIYTGLTAGNYQVNVRDANLCTATMQAVQITQPSAITMSLSSTNESQCSYSNDGTITITASGGTGLLQYSINNGTNWYSNDGSFTSVQAGNYTAVVKDANNCQSVPQAVTITQPDSLYISNVAAVNETPCNSSNNGSITITATGGTLPYFYSFDGEGSWVAGNSKNSLTAGNYTIRVRDNNTCLTQSQVISITEPTVVNFTFTKTNCSCFGVNDGTITITPTGGTGAGYEYSLDGGAWTAIVNPISGIGPTPSPHNLKIRDGAGCESVTKQVTITQPAKVNFTAVKTDETPCSSSNNGTITVQTVTGGAGAGNLANYRYSLDGGSFGTNYTFTGLQAGNHTVIARDLNLCESDPQSFTITEPFTVALSETHTNESPCNNSNNGTITLTATLGSGSGYTYYIDNGAGDSRSNGTGSFINLTAGTWNCYATDGLGCSSATMPITITEPTQVTFTFTQVNITPCFGGSNGEIHITASGGTGPYTYSSGGGYLNNGGNFTGLTANTYTLRVQDNLGCISNPQTATITQPGQVTFTETHADPLCHDDANGTITVSASGGTSPYEYSLNNGTTWPYSDGNISSLAAGTYNVKVRDVNHCESSMTVVVLNNPADVAVTLPVAYTDVTYFGGNDGTMTITVSGGTSPYDFDLNGGSGGFPYSGNSPKLITGLTAGTYHVVVADANSCSADGGNVTISQPGALTIVSAIGTSPGCFGTSTGSIAVTTSGGSGNIQYSSNGGTTWITDTPNDHVYTFTGLAAGVYHIMVKDAFTTVDGGNVTVTDPPQLKIDSQTKTDITCNNANDGTINIVASGGTGNLTYRLRLIPLVEQVNNGLFTGLSSAQYTVTVYDANGCSVQSNKFTILNPTPVILGTVTSTQITCNGANDGKITINVNGGTPETGSQYHFSIDNGAISQQGTSPYSFNNLNPGTYNVVAWDKNNCTKTYSGNPIVISEPPAINITGISHTNILCHGQSTGTITITANGGSPFTGNQYDFSIDGGTSYSRGTSPYTFTAKPAGNYPVIVKDASGCTANGGTEVISQPLSAIAVSTVLWTPDPILCNGDLVTLTITASGGTGTLLYSINNGTNYFNNGGIFPGIAAGTYHVKVKDDNNCELDHGNITITQPAVLAISNIDQVNIKCFGESTGSITISATGGTGTLQYSINGGVDYFANNGLFTGLDARTYNIRVKDANNCILVGPSVTLTEPNNPLTINSSTPTHITTCAGNAEGQITIAVSGGTPIGGTQYKFSIDNGANYSTSTSPYSFTALIAGTYHIKVMDANDCVTDGGNVTVNEPTAIVINDIASVNPLCHGASNGSITITASGGTGLKTYSVEEPANYVDNGGVFAGLTAGNYHIRVQDANNCVKDGGTITLNEPEALTVTVTDSLLSCGSLPVLEADTTFLPDGSGVSYISTIHHTDFDPGQTVMSASDIESICINIEHSYAQDLTMVLTCPDGKSVILVDQDAGGSFVGKPIKDENDFSFPEINTEPGEGFSYCFTQSAIKTWASVYGDSIYTYTDRGGFDHINKIYIPSGVYKPKQNISNLVGCPLNGDWTITVTDNYFGDNGYLFSWGLNFNPSAFPEGYCNGMVEVGVNGGTPNYTYEWSNGRTTQQINDLCAGDYTVTVTDANGCQTNFTTTVKDVDLHLVVDNLTHVTCQGLNNGSITVHMTGGNAPYTYLWETGVTTQTISNLQAGTYSLTVTDFNSCEYIDSITINYQFSITTSLADTALILCHNNTTGLHTGTAAVTAIGDEPISYLWSNGETTATATQLVYGWNYVTVNDAHSCPAKDSIFMNQPAELTSVATLTQPLCNGNQNGNILLTFSGGTPAYTLLWDNGSNDNPRNGIGSGNYAFTVTDNNGCSLNQTLTLDQPALLTTLINSTPTECGDSTGTATVIVSGGTPVYSYLWSNGDNTASADTLKVGWHYVTVTDLNGCIKTDSALIQNNTNLAIAGYTVTSPVSCNGVCDGAVLVNVSGGTQPYSYAWSNGVNNDTTINLCASTSYFVTVTDASNCVVFGSTTITEPAELHVNAINAVNISCFGGSNGSAEAEVTGGTRPYIYIWKNASNQVVGNDSIVSGMVAGVYNISITDAHNCTATATVTLTEPATAVSATHITVSSNCGSADGSATVIPSGGTPAAGLHPYTYNWSNGAGTDSTATGLLAGTYTVTVTDGNGCTFIENITINDNSTLNLVAGTITDATCFGLCNGTAAIVPVNGSKPYDYNWSNGAIDSIATGLCAGPVTVTVTDNDGCQRSMVLNVGEPVNISAVITENQQVLCAGAATGTATMKISGGTAPYIFEWRNALNQLVNTTTSTDSTSTIVNVVAGTYSLLVTDSHTCQKTFPVTINEIAGMNLSFVNKLPACGQSDGFSAITISGGTQPYLIHWETGSNNDTLLNIGSGTYSVTVTDANLCTAIDSITLTDDSNLTVDIQIINPVNCYHDCNGVARANVTGGTQPFNYLWSNGDNHAVANNLCGGNTYSVTVTDANDCLVTYSFTMPQPDSLTVSISNINHNLCFGGSQGSALATAAGGTPNYSYTWRNQSGTIVSSDAQASGLPAGIYSLVVTDARACQATASITINGPTEGITVTLSYIYSFCGGATGTATVTPSGGTPPYTYSWFDGFTGNAHSGLEAGVYNLTVYDANNCPFDTIAIMQDNADMVVDINQLTHVSCSGLCDGKARAIATNGAGPYIYEWSNNDVGVLADSLCSGIIFVTVTDQNFCRKIDFDFITEPEELIISISSTDVLCHGNTDGTATVTATGGTQPYTFTIVNQQGITQSPVLTPSTASLSGLNPGNYNVTVTDSHNCQKTGTIIIGQPQPLTLNFNINPTNCGESTGSATAVPSGGTSPYSFEWSHPLWATDSTGSSIHNLSSDIYWLTVTDYNGCFIDTLVNVPDTSDLEINARITQHVTCISLCNGQATVDIITHTTGVYSFTWSSGATTQSAGNLCLGYYQVTVADINRCQRVDNINLPDDFALKATFAVTEPACHGSSDGSAAVIPADGMPFTGPHPYNYLWSTGSVDSVITNRPAGIYYITVTDASGCEYDDSVEITQPALLYMDITINTPVICHNDSTGDVTVYPHGGIPPYDIALYDNQGIFIDSTSQTLNRSFTQLAAGKYYVQLYDRHYCHVTDSFTLINPPSMVLTFDTTQTHCPENYSGSAKVNIAGGIGPFTVHWYIVGQSDSVLTGFNTNPITGLGVNFYEVEVTDFLGCMVRDTVEITDDSNIDFQLFILNHPLCEDRCNGSARIGNIAGGTPGYTYDWTNGETNDTAFALCIGTNKVYVIDQLGCRRAKIFNLDDHQQLSVYISKLNDISTSGLQCNGYAIANVFGGKRPYTYLWDNPTNSTDSSIFELCEGVYHVTITDAQSPACILNDSVIIVKDSLRYDLVSLDTVTCYGGDNGAIRILARGGYPGSYSYRWAHPGWSSYPAADSTGPAITGLTAGWYYLTITDVGLNSITDSIEVTQPIPYIPYYDMVRTECATPTGSFTVNEPLSEGGTAPFTYYWANASWSSYPLYDSVGISISNIGVSNYYLTIVDANNCTYFDTVKMRDNSPFIIRPVISTPIRCYGFNNGMVDVLALNGTQPYSYAWGHDPANHTNLAAGLSSNTYFVTVTDDHSCIRDTSIFVPQPDSIRFSLRDTVEINCYDSCTGGITVSSVTGGNGGFKYLLKNGETIVRQYDLPALSAICSGSFLIQVRDQLGCISGTLPFAIIQPTAITASFNTQFAQCNVADSSGSVTLTAQGGTPFNGSPEQNYHYLWSNNSNTRVINHLAKGYYFITITDSNSCVKTDSVFLDADINIYPELVIFNTVKKDSVICYGSSVQLAGYHDILFNNVSVDADSIRWSPNNADTAYNPEVSPTDTTVFYYTVYRSGCANTDSVWIGVYPQIFVDAGDYHSILRGDSIQLQATLGTDSTTYYWFGTDYSDSTYHLYGRTPVITPIDSLIIYVEATTGKCKITDSARLKVFQKLNPPSGFTPNGDGINDTWLIPGIMEWPNAEVQIYNRWGERVLYMKGFYKPWEGKSKNGKDLPIGTYYYIIDLHDGRTKPISGPITIIR